MNEWGFAGEIKSWWDAEFSRRPEWHLDRCGIEEVPEGAGRIRSDLTVHNDAGAIVLSGELRLPDHPQASPWDTANLQDALTKAQNHHARWAFTSDANTLVLLDVHITGPAVSRVVDRIHIGALQDRTALDSPVALAEMRTGWRQAIAHIAPIILGLAPAPGMAPDEVFISALHALLHQPIGAIRHALDARRQQDQAFERDLVRWMVDEQGWTHVPNQWAAEIDRTANLTAYVFTTRLMFYEALRRQHPEMSELDVPGRSANVARAAMRAYFEDARERSGDYETIFTWDRACEYALISDHTTAGWRRVVDHLAGFNLASIPYDVLGKLFERLIDPHERYRWGQHYTSPSVVDLMLSLALPDGAGSILDPAVGGGTFLVRAYARKRALQPGHSHQELLTELNGFDISAFAASLATFNLAVRDLSFAANYPQVAARSFFRTQPAETFMALPAPAAVALDEQSTRRVSIAAVSAVVCNPPYVRVHELAADQRREAEAVLGRGSVSTPGRLHGNANYHVFFWLHAAQFLDEHGRLVFITSGEWMDSDYGAALQQWLLDHFVIECCIESLAEPWFSEARVGTVVVAARLCPDSATRDVARVRFVTLRRPLVDLYGPTTDDREHFDRVDEVRDRLLGLEGEFGESEDFDWSTVTQAELRVLGRETGAAA